MSQINSVSNNYNKNIIATNDGKKYQKPDSGRKAAAAAAACASVPIVYTGIRELTALPYRRFYELLTDADNCEYKKVLEKVLNKTGLASKGVKIIDITENNKEVVNDLINKSFSENHKKIFNQNPVLKKIINTHIEKISNAIADGKQALHFSKINTITLNKNLYSVAAFHEMGHALNNNFSKIGKLINSLKLPFSYLAPLAFTTALFKRKKADGEKPEGWFDKATTFIKNNCGKLAFVSTLPVLADEAMASIKASKITKGVLPLEQFKKMNKFNFAAWLTYFGTTIAATAAVVTASKIADSIAAPKEIKD